MCNCGASANAMGAGDAPNNIPTLVLVGGFVVVLALLGVMNGENKKAAAYRERAPYSRRH